MKVKEEALWLQSLTLIHEFERYVLEHPRFAEKIPPRAQVVLLPIYDPDLCAYNLRNASINHEPKRPVVYVEIDHLRPRRSQIVRPRMKIEAPLSKNGKRRTFKRIVSAHV